MSATGAYPGNTVERSRWIQERRGSKNAVDANRPYAQLLERERMEDGRIAEVATVFLTNRECPWKCVMCDLWRNTAPAPRGAVTRQISWALKTLAAGGQASVLKLYNSGSFFDSGAIPRSEWGEIASLCAGFEQIIVECHPRLVNDEVSRFAETVGGKLEVAMGLETANPIALEKLNKRITLEDFQSAANFLRRRRIGIRTFLLVGVPFIRQEEQWEWMRISMEVAFDAGVAVVSLIPTRAGNGALDELERFGEFREPSLGDVEEAQEFGLQQQAGRVIADTWDLERFCGCSRCGRARRERLERMNLAQRIEARVECVCAG